MLGLVGPVSGEVAEVFEFGVRIWMSHEDESAKLICQTSM